MIAIRIYCNWNFSDDLWNDGVLYDMTGDARMTSCIVDDHMAWNCVIRRFLHFHGVLHSLTCRVTSGVLMLDGVTISILLTAKARNGMVLVLRVVCLNDRRCCDWLNLRYDSDRVWVEVVMVLDNCSLQLILDHCTVIRMWPKDRLHKWYLLIIGRLLIDYDDFLSTLLACLLVFFSFAISFGFGFSFRFSFLFIFTALLFLIFF